MNNFLFSEKFKGSLHKFEPEFISQPGIENGNKNINENLQELEIGFQEKPSVISITERTSEIYEIKFNLPIENGFDGNNNIMSNFKSGTEIIFKHANDPMANVHLRILKIISIDTILAKVLSITNLTSFTMVFDIRGFLIYKKTN